MCVDGWWHMQWWDGAHNENRLSRVSTHALNRGLPAQNIPREPDCCQPFSLWLGVCWDLQLAA